MLRGNWSSACLVLLGCAAWAGNALYAWGEPGGVVKHYSPALVALALAGFFIWHGNRRYGRRTIFQFAIIVFLVGWMFETLSVNTGIPFGRYHYTEIMAPFLGHVPVFVLPAYLFMGYAAWSLATLFCGVRTAALPAEAVYRVPLVAAILMVIWDLSMDPLRATIEGRWIWIDGGAYFGVPVSNFFGWLIVTWCMFQGFALLLSSRKTDHPMGIEDDPYYWAAIPVTFTCFAGEYLLNPVFGHNRLIEVAGRTELTAEEIQSAIAMLSWVTWVPILIVGLILSVGLPRFASPPATQWPDRAPQKVRK